MVRNRMRAYTGCIRDYRTVPGSWMPQGPKLICFLVRPDVETFDARESLARILDTPIDVDR